jgi:hypothetical protein
MTHREAAKSRIPTFASLEDEAAFWGSHDSTEFADEFEPVAMGVSRPLMHGLIVEFEGETFHRLVAAAKHRGMGPATLAQQWITAALERDEADRSKPERP